MSKLDEYGDAYLDVQLPAMFDVSTDGILPQLLLFNKWNVLSITGPCC